MTEEVRTHLLFLQLELELNEYSVNVVEWLHGLVPTPCKDNC